MIEKNLPLKEFVKNIDNYDTEKLFLNMLKIHEKFCKEINKKFQTNITIKERRN